MKASPNTIISFDYSSLFVDTDMNSAPLFVTASTGTDPWKFWTYNNNKFEQLQSAACTGTTSATYVQLLRNYLILKDSGVYKLCILSPSALTTAMTPINLELSAKTIG